ncbi:molybdopterin-dependent oxidoreductase [Aureimonas populi]|uniref:Molybdopterin-dependent oxidoreductase n=1 Tax=Aureimonas populi TaxID=1701758 RepID=A0ABW5CLD5_9HYPH|nr:molybdopterin-dependent oxidoreductase [Aureimonas populi]
MHLLGTHYGTYEVRDDGRGGQRLVPFRHDPDPSPIGLSLLEMADHPARIPTPMVRRGWMEGRERPGERGRDRGRDEFMPVEWEEAIGLVAGEIERVRGTHSSEAIFGGSYGWASAGRLHHAQSQLKRFLNLGGGFVSSVGTYSYGAATVLLPHIVGARATSQTDGPSWDLIEKHARVVVSFGGFRLTNAQVGAGGVGSHSTRQWLERTVRSAERVIVVSPVEGDIPDIEGRERIEFVPIRPNTDIALLLGASCELILAGRADEGFLARCTTGYEPFRAYLLGETDGIAKTAEWAARICGVPAAKIREIAGLVAGKPSLLNAAWSLQRARFGEQPYWGLIALAAMAGQIGRPGCGFAFGLTASSSIGEPIRRLHGPSVPQGQNPVKAFIPVARITELLSQPGGTLEFDGRTLALPDIRLVYWAGGNPFHHHQDLHRLAEAWRRPETVIVNESVWTATARHADIVLPATMPFERDDIVAASKDRWIVASRKVREPFAGARNDRDIFAALAERMGFGETFTEGLGEAGWLERIYAGYRQGFPELPPFETFWAEGFAALDPQAQAPRPHIPFADFVGDPARHPLDTVSGRIEISCETIAGFGYADAPPHPAWLAPEEAAAPGARAWPLHLLSPQPAHRLHSQLDHGAVSRAAKRGGLEVAFMNARDAARRGLAHGDAAEIVNDRGRCLVSLDTSAAIEPGIVVLPTGGWFDPVALPDGSVVDRGGNPNVLTSHLGTSRLGQGSAPNTCHVDVRRFEGALAGGGRDGP